MRMLSLLVLLLTALPALGAMYKWVDEDGTVHYGEQPPPGRPHERIRPAPRPSGAGPQAAERLQKLRAQIEAASKAQAAAEAEAARNEAEARRRRQNCAIARRNLANLGKGGRKMLRGPDGVAYFPTPEEIEAKRAEARKAIEANCR